MTKRMFYNSIAFLIVVVIVFGCIVSTMAASVTLKWDANTEADLKGYKLYYGTIPRGYDTPYDVGNKTVFTVPDLQEGVKYYFAVTAYDVTGNESGYSNEVSTIFIDMTPPGVPQQFRIHVIVQ